MTNLTRLAVALVLLTACGTPEEQSKPPCDGVTIDGSEQYWSANKGEPTWCAELAEAYTAEADVGSGAITVNEDECTAAFVVHEGDTTISATCDMDVAGNADCDVRVDVAGERCELRLQVMP